MLKKIAVYTLKTAAVLALFMAALSVSMMILPMPPGFADAVPANEQAWLLPLVLAAALIKIVLLSAIILKTDWPFKIQAPALTLSVYLISVFIMLLDLVWLRRSFPALTDRDLVFMFVRDFIALLIFIPGVVFIYRGLGKKEREQPSFKAFFNLTHLDFGRAGYKVLLIAVIHIFVYFTAGFIFAWSNPELREFYDAWATSPDLNLLMIPFQFIRGCLWTLFLMPLLMLIKSRKQAFLILPVFLAVFTGIDLIIPNPLMPAAIRFSHLIELIVSKALFGFIITWMIYRKPKPAALK